jgi:hypothetical protein
MQKRLALSLAFMQSHLMPNALLPATEFALRQFTGYEQAVIKTLVSHWGFDVTKAIERVKTERRSVWTAESLGVSAPQVACGMAL